jgi:uncharacterized membrane protein YsdA (DUF1294 family)
VLLAGHPVLLYAGGGVWVAQQVFRHPPGQNRVGFVFPVIIFA